VTAGSAPAIFIMESIVEAVGRSLGAAGGTVRARNLYAAGAVTPYGQPLPYCSLRTLWKRMWDEAEVEKRRADIVAFNKVRKRRGGGGWEGGRPYRTVV
jgi:xanthine dehydrogenase/oxidase